MTPQDVRPLTANTPQAVAACPSCCCADPLVSHVPACVCAADGDLDLLVHGVMAPMRLYRNNGDGTYTEVTDTPVTVGEYVTAARSQDLGNACLLRCPMFDLSCWQQVRAKGCVARRGQ